LVMTCQCSECTVQLVFPLSSWTLTLQQCQIEPLEVISYVDGFLVPAAATSVHLIGLSWSQISVSWTSSLKCARRYKCKGWSNKEARWSDPFTESSCPGSCSHVSCTHDMQSKEGHGHA
jgi:hypothetical protein